jgi:hypothetical protein
MTEHNHHRHTRQRSRHGTPWAMRAGESKIWQQFAHGKRRQLVRKLITTRPDDIPGNTPRHVRWDYW